MNRLSKTASPAIRAMRRLIQRPAFLLLGALSLTPAWGQTGPPVTTEKAPMTVPAAQLQADFALFKQAYQEFHPGLYRYNTKQQMDAHFAELEKQFQKDRTLSDAYLAFAVFLTKIKCGHCYPNFYNQPQAVVEALFRNQDRVPFHFRWIDRRMIVTRNLSEDARLIPGTEVLSLNGVPVKTILAKLLTVSRADGSNDLKRVSNLEIRGGQPV